MKTQLGILSLALAAIALTSSAQAQNCGGWGGCGYDYGYLYNSLEYNVPYFAAHPPVYYSAPVPRTYGFSPFAYPPNVMTPEIDFSDAPAEIINPYVPNSQQEAAKPQGDQTASRVNVSAPQPLVILNPFVTGERAMAQK